MFSYYPKQWKESRVILIPKPNKPLHIPSSYRPICVNSILGKVLERLVYNRLYHFLHINHLLHPKQYGFTHKLSTTAALVQIKSIILTEIKAQNKPIIISLDISNAFNTLWTPFVLQYLKRHNIPRNLYLLLQTILTDRTIIYPTQSTPVSLHAPLGSPQGSPLSPLLWSIMISSLLDLSHPANVHIQAFADDITLVVAGKTRLQIQTLANKTLHMIHTWSNQHHITFNPSKCNFILIGNHYLKRPPTIKLGNHNIRHTHELNILGIIFDHKLSFIPHTTYLRDKIYKHTIALSLFSGLHWGFSPKHFRALYTRSLERIITYGAPVFFQPTPNSHLIRKLISIQRIPLLKICKAFSTVSNASINILTNILPIEYTLSREIALFHIFQLKQPYTLYETTYDPNKIQHHIDIWDTHPAQLLSFPFTIGKTSLHQMSHETTYNIYTDGSLLNETVGAAFVTLDNLQHITMYGRYKLPSFTSIYEAELQAIKQALLSAVTLPRGCSFTLFSDSRSALNAIANPYNTHSTVQEIKELKKLNTTHPIQLIHIRSHTNIQGNDIADYLANTSRHTGTPVNLFPNKQYIRKQIRQQQYIL